jgi:hypothetical protein
MRESTHLIKADNKIIYTVVKVSKSPYVWIRACANGNVQVINPASLTKRQNDDILEYEINTV